MQLPNSLKRYKNEAKELILRGNIAEKYFTGFAYQVHVLSKNSDEEDQWVFLQLKDDNSLNDSVCGCEEAEQTHGCVHIAAAYSSIFDKTNLALHQKFYDSFWYHITKIFEEMIGSDISFLIEKEPNCFIASFHSEKSLMKIEILTEDCRKTLDKVFFEREIETEENSIKFLNLSSDELSLWREGRPPESLRYELSFWSDFAKICHQKQESEKYLVDFSYSTITGLPKWIDISFADLKVGFYLSEANLALLVPSMRFLKSKISVIGQNIASVSQIYFDKESRTLNLSYQNENSTQHIDEKLIGENKTVEVGDWLFIPAKKMFVPANNEIVEKKVVSESEIATFLTEYTNLVASHLSECTLYINPVNLKYKIYFDIHKNLHIAAYLFVEGDLSSNYSFMTGDWLYVDADGFYRLENKFFDQLVQVIKRPYISDFISLNRAWFNQQDGFHTHVKSLETEVEYDVLNDCSIKFYKKKCRSLDSKNIFDVGSWTYVQDRGFYAKEAASITFLMKEVLIVEQVPLFIKINLDDLKNIKGFFAERQLIDEIKLNVFLDEPRSLKIVPHYTLQPDLRGCRYFIYDEFVYVEGYGFSETAASLLLPDKFNTTTYLEKSEVDQFFKFEYDALVPHLNQVDTELLKPLEVKLVLEEIEKRKIGKNQSYTCKLSYVTEYGRVNVCQLREAICKPGLKYHLCSAGRFNLHDSRFDWLRKIPAKNWKMESQQVQLSSLDFFQVYGYDPIEAGSDLSENQAHTFDTLANLKPDEELDFTGLKSALRSYQKVGLKWLWFLYTQKMSGLLCDDMGLGKTHQAMGLIAAVSNFAAKFSLERPRFLIVCPTSVLYHWQEKLSYYLPSKKVLLYYGFDRKLDDADIILTSYGIMRLDIDQLSKIFFEIAILDEIQVAKNQLSLMHLSVKKIEAMMRLGLTGTPIENRLRELKSLFDIVLPHYLPDDKQYRELFIKPIEKQEDLAKKMTLNRLINPFTLRRKKEQVLSDLPEKIEEKSYCSLSKEQATLYNNLLLQRSHAILDDLQKSTPIPFIHVFSLLSSLKQICNHPAVYLKDAAGYENYSSGKWSLFVELLREARNSKQKVVVFTQYLTMIEIFCRYLDDNDIGYAKIQGATKNRKEQLDRFAADPNCEVFIGSLQAAGLGIDLTAASVVIHYDRWWNAAREGQGTDRVYRIGQTKGVHVIKLITKGTFEEKIDKMIQKKGKLMEEIVGVDEQNTLKKFNREEISSLLDFYTQSN